MCWIVMGWSSRVKDSPGLFGFIGTLFAQMSKYLELGLVLQSEVDSALERTEAEECGLPSTSGGEGALCLSCVDGRKAGRLFPIWMVGGQQER